MATLLIGRPGPAADPAAAAEPAGAVCADRGPSSIVPRARLVTVCLGLLAFTLAQQPGRVVADTKLDLTVDPWGFLARALNMWEPRGFAGQVQNQAYGYLFPM